MTAPPFLPLRTVPLGNVYHRWQSVCTERHVGGTHLVNYRRPIATRTPLDHAGGIRSSLAAAKPAATGSKNTRHVPRFSRAPDTIPQRSQCAI
jgi:hypothetical protein